VIFNRRYRSQRPARCTHPTLARATVRATVRTVRDGMFWSAVDYPSPADLAAIRNLINREMRGDQP
jgi:hypothetical protein